jgi:hypothetical protein
MMAEMRAGHEEMKARLEAKIDAMNAKLDAHQEEMNAMLNACLEKMEADPGEVQSVVVHQEVFKKDVAVESGRARNKRPGDRNLAVGHRGKSKERTQGNGCSRKNLAAARRGGDPPCRSNTA